VADSYDRKGQKIGEVREGKSFSYHPFRPEKDLKRSELEEERSLGEKEANEAGFGG